MMADVAGDFVGEIATAWPVASWRDVHVAVAVSAGADSVALLHALLQLKEVGGGAGRVFAVHVNHQLRGDASDSDERWLGQQCQRLGVELQVERTNAAALADERGDGLEEAAREARYRSLAAVAAAVGARYVATGHTVDDQVETVLFRLLRGTGLKGLAGMPAVRSLSPSVTLVRPMLRLRRSEVLQYLALIGQEFREDASNADRGFTRNRLRHELLPLLRRDYNREVDAAIVRTAEFAGEAQAVVDGIAAALFEQCRREPVVGGADSHSAAETWLQLSPLLGQPELIVREVLRRAWREAGFAEQAMSGRAWRELAQFAQTHGAGVLALPGGVRASFPAAGLLALRAMRLP